MKNYLDTQNPRGDSDPTKPRKVSKRQEMRDFNKGTMFWRSEVLGTYVRGMIRNVKGRTYGVSRGQRVQ